MAQAYSFQFLNLEREESVRVECAAVHTHDTSTDPRHRDHTLCTFKCFSISNPTHNTPWSASFKGSVVRGWFESAVLEYWNHSNRQCFGLFGYKFENHKSFFFFFFLKRPRFTDHKVAKRQKGTLLSSLSQARSGFTGFMETFAGEKCPQWHRWPFYIILYTHRPKHVHIYAIIRSTNRAAAAQGIKSYRYGSRASVKIQHRGKKMRSQWLRLSRWC